MLSPIQFVPVPFKKLFSILYTLELRTFINSFKAVSFTGRVSRGCIQNPSCPLTMLEALKIDLCLMLQYKKLHHQQSLTITVEAEPKQYYYKSHCFYSFKKFCLGFIFTITQSRQNYFFHLNVFANALHIQSRQKVERVKGGNGTQSFHFLPVLH